MKLIDKYLPSDYNDSVSKRIKLAEPLTPDAIFEGMFCNFPKPVDWLFKLRNAIVKPFGLQGGGGFGKLISERNDEEIILSKYDKHLCFWVGLWAFHKLLVKGILRRTLIRAQQTCNINK